MEGVRGALGVLGENRGDGQGDRPRVGLRRVRVEQRDALRDGVHHVAVHVLIPADAERMQLVSAPVGGDSDADGDGVGANVANGRGQVRGGGPVPLSNPTVTVAGETQAIRQPL